MATLFISSLKQRSKPSSCGLLMSERSEGIKNGEFGNKKNDLNQIAKKLKVTKENRVDEKLNGDVISIYQCSSPGNPQSISLNMRKRGSTEKK